jgi:cysteine desulfurase
VLLRMPDLPVYMDNHATTRVDPRVFEAMAPYFTERYGNPGSGNHPFGWAAKEAVDAARAEIATAVGAGERDIVFTSGATESNNLAIRGIAERARRKGNHLVSVATEHKSVLDPLARLGRRGFDVTLLPVEQAGSELSGVLDLDRLEAAIRDGTILVSVMLANNEIGVIQPLADIAAICRQRGVPLHCDATQAVGKMPVDVDVLGVDLMSFTAHKMYGPKGVGALYVRRKNPRVQISAIIDGGGHERGMRSGTLNVAGIVGLGKACAIASEEMAKEACHLAGMRNRLRDRIMSRLDEVYINGSWDHRLPGNLNISFAYVEGESLLMGINDIAVSSGSACTSATLEPSYVLKALGTGDDLAHSSIRFGIGRFNTEAEIDYVADRVVETVSRLRELSPLYEMAKEGVDLKTVKWAAE